MEKDVVVKNSKSLSPSSPDGELMFLDALIGDKKMVMLGEFDHRVKEANLIKNRLIRYLHANHGFNVILFESGIGELIATDMHKDILSGNQMTYGLFGYWRSPEFSELMEYVKASGSISVAGFDVQRTGRSFHQYLKELNVLTMAPTDFDALENRFTNLQEDLRKGELTDDLINRTDSLINDYASLAEIWGDAGLTSSYEKMAIRTLYNRMAYLQYFLEFRQTNDYETRWNDRDSLMAENTRYLIEEIFPDQKFVVIGHNFHVSKYNEDLEVMGEYLNRNFIDFVSIGVFGGSGQIGFNDDIREMESASTDGLDLKQVISVIPEDYVFYSISDKEPTKWIANPIIINDTFINLSGRNYLTLNKHFDGLVLIKKVSPVTSID